MRSATVVLPVPGLPVKLMCSVGVSDEMPSFLRSRSTRSSAAISRMRFLTGFRPTSSRSSLLEHLVDVRCLELRLQVDQRRRLAAGTRLVYASRA